jgi:hypothetical protein
MRSHHAARSLDALEQHVGDPVRPSPTLHGSPSSVVGVVTTTAPSAAATAPRGIRRLEGPPLTPRDPAIARDEQRAPGRRYDDPDTRPPWRAGTHREPSRLAHDPLELVHAPDLCREAARWDS